jgi:bifunctional enzyme CysN/CysC
VEIKAHLDLESLGERSAATCAANDIAVARLALGRGAAMDPFARLPATGSFVLVDAVTGASVAGGIVARVDEEARKAAPDAFRLTRSLLKQGIGADLGSDAASEQELSRRANEVAILLRGAGVKVELEDKLSGTGIDFGAIGLGVLAALSFGYAAAIVFGLV